jgi:hypothetical protein
MHDTLADIPLRCYPQKQTGKLVNVTVNSIILALLEQFAKPLGKAKYILCQVAFDYPEAQSKDLVSVISRVILKHTEIKMKLRGIRRTRKLKKAGLRPTKIHFPNHL